MREVVCTNAPANHAHNHVQELICGIDEAGRGPLAGPVVAAAVILPKGFDTSCLADSKKLSAKRREEALVQIEAQARIGVGFATVPEIDDINIFHATMLAMQRAVFRLGKVPDLALVDGNKTPDLPCRAQAIVGGDATEPAISAASIVAKVTRDRVMQKLHCKYPAYGWGNNAGYGTKEHKAALNIWGVTPHHRTSFAPVREMLG